MVFTKIKFGLLQVLIQCTKLSGQEVIHLILTLTLFIVLLQFVLIGQLWDFVDENFFQKFNQFLLVHFYCTFDVCYTIFL
jgi:hypothetical protein